MGNQRNRDSAMAYRRQEAYQRLEQIDAHRLRLSGRGIEFIAARAETTAHRVRRWLQEVAAQPQQTTQSTPGQYLA